MRKSVFADFLILLVRFFRSFSAPKILWSFCCSPQDSPPRNFGETPENFDYPKVSNLRIQFKRIHIRLPLSASHYEFIN